MCVPQHFELAKVLSCITNKAFWLFGNTNIRYIPGLNFLYAYTRHEIKNKILIIKTCIPVWSNAMNEGLLPRVYFNVCLLDFVNIWYAI